VNPARRRSLLFLLRFVVLLGVFAFLVAWKPVNDGVIVPFTAGVAHLSAAVLNAIGENVAVTGTQLHAAGFSVDIENGCNGVETALLFCSAVLAFPASWRARIAGLLLGFVAIELLNLVRVVTLFWIGHHRPALFSAAHTVLWQSAVVISGVLLFLLWASRQKDSASVPVGAAEP
jgi:exosortase H (IPTLxxWG-CTERM-specific)